MIYIIISNVGMAIMMIFVYFRYSRFRLSSATEIKTLQKKCEDLAQEVKDTDHKMLQTNKADSEKIQSLLTDLDGLRKEKENEIKLRMNAEKQIELTMQKVEELQKRIDDWRVMQDAMMHDTKEVMLKIGNDLFKKLNDSYKQEIETNKNLLGKITKIVTDSFEKISAAQLHAKKEVKSVETRKALATSGAKAQSVELESASAKSNPNDPSKKLIPDLVELMKAGGHMVNKNYFVAANLDEQKAKLMLCDVAFLNSGKLNIIDFKSCVHLLEYNQQKDKNKTAAEAALKQKLDKYLAYLSNPKYRDSILKVMTAGKVKFEKNSIIIAAQSNEDLQVWKDLHYYEKAQKLGLEILEYDEINNLVL